MEKLITKTSQITTTIISNATGKNTYAIERTLSNIKGDTAIIVLLYPTVSSTRPFSEDSTLLHLTRHMAEMKLNRIVIINLFSYVCRSRLSTRGIKVDENNLRIIEKIITEKKKEHNAKLILAWGTSMSNCKAARETKKRRNEESKELKKALEGSIERYEVTYVSGLPEVPKKKSGAIGLNIMPDMFSFRPTITTKEWFPEYDIPYNTISELRIEKRTISTTEVLLGAGDNANQEQENVICILYTSADGKKLTLRVEMLTGTTIFNQAAKCREFMDLLRQHEITDKFISEKKNDSNTSSGGNDVLAQLEKLNQLKQAGILTDEEFNAKKADLLAKL